MKNILVVLLILKDKDGRVLMIKRANTSHGLGMWCLPAGKVEEGETLEEACKREAKEEVNLNLSNLQLFLLRTEVSTEQIGKVYDCNYFTANFNGEISLNEESSDFKFFTKKDFLKEETVPDQRDVLKKLFDRS